MGTYYNCFKSRVYTEDNVKQRPASSRPGTVYLGVRGTVLSGVSHARACTHACAHTHARFVTGNSSRRSMTLFMRDIHGYCCRPDSRPGGQRAHWILPGLTVTSHQGTCSRDTIGCRRSLSHMGHVIYTIQPVTWEGWLLTIITTKYDWRPLGTIRIHNNSHYNIAQN